MEEEQVEFERIRWCTPCGSKWDKGVVCPDCNTPLFEAVVVPICRYLPKTVWRTSALQIPVDTS